MAAKNSGCWEVRPSRSRALRCGEGACSGRSPIVLISRSARPALRHPKNRDTPHSWSCTGSRRRRADRSRSPRSSPCPRNSGGGCASNTSRSRPTSPDRSNPRSQALPPLGPPRRRRTQRSPRRTRRRLSKGGHAHSAPSHVGTAAPHPQPDTGSQNVPFHAAPRNVWQTPV
jgi:hypothetical protein